MVNIAAPMVTPAVTSDVESLSIGDLACVAAAVLWDARQRGLPRPCYLTVHDTGSVGVQFADNKASVGALTWWLEAFGGTIAMNDICRDDGTPARLIRVRFDYLSTPIEAYALIPMAKLATT
jgi:hypothetical protein